MSGYVGFLPHPHTSYIYAVISDYCMYVDSSKSSSILCRKYVGRGKNPTHFFENVFVLVGYFCVKLISMVHVHCAASGLMYTYNTKCAQHTYTIGAMDHLPSNYSPFRQQLEGSWFRSHFNSAWHTNCNTSDRQHGWWHTARLFTGFFQSRLLSRRLTCRVKRRFLLPYTDGSAGFLANG